MSDDLQLMLNTKEGEHLRLPAPARSGQVSVEGAIAGRRSVRSFSPEPLALKAVSQLLWSAQGMTAKEGLRAAPSAGACYPLEVYALVEQGLFRYLPAAQALLKALAGDRRQALAQACYGQMFVAEAPLSLIFTAIYERTTSRYGERGLRYVHIDVGHAAQNVHLQAEALGLASVPVGAFDDAAVSEALALPAQEHPLYLVPIGRPAG